MKLYQARDDEGEGDYFLTKREAEAEARRRSQDMSGDIEVVRVVCNTNKEGILALANGRGWVVESSVVRTFKSKQKPDDGE